MLSLWGVEIVGWDKSTVNCKVHNGHSTATLTRMVDTGVNISVVSTAEWPKKWGLKPVKGRITGIGGLAASVQSANNIIAEGLNGHIAII